MYQKYSTEALILASRESGEGDRIITLLTKDFGLVRARAGAVRTERSRMRYALQNYSRSSVSLVRGRKGWRLAGASALKVASGERESIAVFARIAILTIRLLAGEEQDQYLFAALADAHGALMQETCPARATIEIVCVARVLYALGYISAEAHATALFTHTAYADEFLREAETMKDKLLSSINRAITETQLL